MAKRKSTKRPGPSKVEAAEAEQEKQHRSRKDGWRETIESVAIALMLAFLFRTFEAEAFEIPTGSMGPTLMGRHKDVECPQCGYRYRVGSSSEVTREGVPIPQNTVRAVTCPMCRFTAQIEQADRLGGGEMIDAPSYQGDRIWVSKVPYTIGDPKRWDVAVFKYPKEASENYIKRIVGLPGESIRIQQGDIFADPAGGNEFQIARKPPHKVMAEAQDVYNNDYVLDRLVEAGWPLRWQADKPSGQGNWESEDGGRSFAADGTANTDRWIRYRHIVPYALDWQEIEQNGQLPPDYQPKPQLISDFCAYNTAAPNRLNGGMNPSPSALGLHWVGDLIFECELESTADDGSVTLELVEAGNRFRCSLDLATGKATLSIVSDPELAAKDDQSGRIKGAESFAPTAETDVQGAGTWKLRFANVDNQLTLWVDDEAVEFDGDTSYDSPAPWRPRKADLTPVAIGTHGAAIVARHLRILRDTYYVAPEQGMDFMSDYLKNPFITIQPVYHGLQDFLSDERKWDVFYNLRHRDLPDNAPRLADDEFLAMGDNSPNSLDGRMWGPVKRELLIGKAFFVYWPHAWPTYPSIPIKFRGREIRIPFYPNVGRMRWIE